MLINIWMNHFVHVLDEIYSTFLNHYSLNRMFKSIVDLGSEAVLNMIVLFIFLYFKIPGLPKEGAKPPISRTTDDHRCRLDEVCYAPSYSLHSKRNKSRIRCDTF